MLVTLLVILLVLGLIGGLPTWGYWGTSGSPYGYYPSGGFGVILLLIIIFLVL